MVVSNFTLRNASFTKACFIKKIIFQDEYGFYHYEAFHASCNIHAVQKDLKTVNTLILLSKDNLYFLHMSVYMRESTYIHTSM